MQGLYRPRYRDKKTGELRESAVYWLRFSVRGRLIRESTGATDENEARAKLAQRIAEAHAGRIIPQARRVTLLASLGIMLLDSYKANGFKSTERASLSLKHLFEHFDPRTRAHELTGADVARYVSARLEAGASRATCNRETAALKRAFNIAVQQGALVMRPAFPPSLRENNARRGFVTREQLDSLLVRLSDAIRPLIQTAFITGWRVRSELLPMRWHQIDFEGGWIRLEPNTTKNREGREFPLIAELRSVLETQRARTSALERCECRLVPFVFHRNGVPIREFKRSWATATRNAGLPGLHPHDMRRSAARNLIRAGVPQVVAMRLCGWKSQAMLQRYAIVEADMLTEAGAKLSAFLNQTPAPESSQRG